MYVNIQINTDLSSKTTFGISAKTRYYVEFSDSSDVYLLSDFLDDVHVPSQLLGGGSNTIFCADYPGVVVKNNCVDLRRLNKVKVYVEAGYLLDSFVEWTVQNGLCGIEALSGIPGTLGGAIALNAGAYGACIGDCLESVTVYDTALRKTSSLTRSELHYHHRSSIFRNCRGQNIIILGAVFHLKRTFTAPNHPKIKERGLITSPQKLRSEILLLRSHIPNPSLYKNAGSFFLNPTVSSKRANSLRNTFPGIAIKPIGGHRYQIAVGWILDKAGLKGTRHGTFTFNESHANIVINESISARGSDVIDFICKIQSIVYEQFGLDIVPEPLLIGEEFWQGSFYKPSLLNPVTKS